MDNDSYYFRGYAHWGVHETMLTDTVRTGGYERAICDNASFFKGKVGIDCCLCLSSFLSLSPLRFKPVSQKRRGAIVMEWSVIGPDKVERLRQRFSGGPELILPVLP